MKKLYKTKTKKELFDNSIIFLILISALISFILNIVILIFNSTLLHLNYFIIIFQLSIALTGLGIIIKQTLKHPEFQLTKISNNDAFWKKKNKINNLDIIALNGIRFIEKILDEDIEVKKLRLIIPNNKSIKNYYQSDKIVSNSAFSYSTLETSIKDLENMIKSSNNIHYHSISRADSFIFTFIAIANNNYSLCGMYSKDKNREHSVGLTSSAWFEENPKLIHFYSNYFENLWNILNNE